MAKRVRYVGGVQSPLLQLNGICKSFAGVAALRPLRLSLRAGESLGLIGENGAGKSTLIKILSGVHQPDAGELLWQGRPVRFHSPHEAMQAGLATIHQELACFGPLTVAENLMLGEPWPRSRWGGVHWLALYDEAQRRLDRFGLHVQPEQFFHELSPAQKQEVAIARALATKARLLILDEPTASLSEPEVARLFDRLQALRKSGVSLIYVSHRLDEILDITNGVAVLRDGELAAEYPTAQATVPRMIKDMVGRPLDQVYPRTRLKTAGDVALELVGATRQGMFQEVSFQVRAGEIVGLAGLVGAGRSELARAIYGLYSMDRGTIRINGQNLAPRGAQAMHEAGLAYVPEERKRQGLVMEHSVGEAISIGFTDLLVKWGLVRLAEERRRVGRALATYSIRASSPHQPVGLLSGGNQQKALLARWLTREPRIIILDEPTRGVDVGAKGEIHAEIDRLAASGKAVLLISSDLPEVLGMSDRLLVMHEGRIASELSGAAMTQENVLLAASGLYHGAQN